MNDFHARCFERVSIQFYQVRNKETLSFKSLRNPIGHKPRHHHTVVTCWLLFHCAHLFVLLCSAFVLVCLLYFVSPQIYHLWIPGLSTSVPCNYGTHPWCVGQLFHKKWLCIFPLPTFHTSGQLLSQHTTPPAVWLHRRQTCSCRAHARTLSHTADTIIWRVISGRQWLEDTEESNLGGPTF